MKGTYFRTEIIGNSVNDADKVVYGESSEKKTPYAIFKVAVNTTKDNTAFLNIISWGEHNVAYLKEHYFKGMRLHIAAGVSQQYVRDAEGKIVKEIMYFNVIEMNNLSARKSENVQATLEEAVTVEA